MSEEFKKLISILMFDNIDFKTHKTAFGNNDFYVMTYDNPFNSNIYWEIDDTIKGLYCFFCDGEGYQNNIDLIVNKIKEIERI